MNKEQIFSDSFFAMGTRCDLVFAGVEEVKARRVFELVKKEVETLEFSLSRFVPDSSISKLNEAKKNVWIDVPDDLWDILNICYDFYQMSKGAFDITIASLIDLWNTTENPNDNEIRVAQKSCGFDNVELDVEHQKIKFLTDEIQFDLGAIGKGIVLDSLKTLLSEHEIRSGIVSFGESSVLAIGKHPSGKNWPIGIRNNYRINEFVHVFSACDESITTSGSLLSSDEGTVAKPQRIISPSSGLPVDKNKTVSVKTTSATMGAFLSTGWMILPENDKIILSDQFKDMEILEVEYAENETKTKLTIL